MTTRAVLYDPDRHEALSGAMWNDDEARAAIDRWVDRALADLDPASGWRPHPRDEQPPSAEPLCELYGGAGGAIWALEHLAASGAVQKRWDFNGLVRALPPRQVADLEEGLHGTASFLIGESGLRLLEWRVTQDDSAAQRLYDVVEGNLHNPVREQLWGSSGSVLAAISMAERTGEARWADLVRRNVQVLWDEMEPIEDAGGRWGWVQDLYGRTGTLIGAGHGFVGNVYPAVRGAAFIDTSLRDAFAARALDFLQVTALRDDGCVNWRPRVAPSTPGDKPPLVQDCHGAAGVVCRLAPLPRSVPDAAVWDELLSAAGELTWRAGPLTKGVAFCHGTAGNAQAFLHLYARTGDERWLGRARAFAMHGIAQVERDSVHHGQGRHALWTGDLGMACVLWGCIQGRPALPTLEAL